MSRTPREQTEIVIFRLPMSVCRDFDKKCRPVVGIRSRNQHIRKLVDDYSKGKVQYLRKQDELANPTLTKA
jgi:hypothetical protein